VTDMTAAKPPRQGASRTPLLGLIVNPVAGLGGRVGLKGSDGAEILARARALGAVPECPGRARQALEQLADLAGTLELVTYPGEMGEQSARAAGFSPRVIGSISPGATSGEDSRRAAAEMLDLGADLILFAGGDGTARDICRAAADRGVVLGVPGGVKIHSGVYAASPVHAGRLARRYLLDPAAAPPREAEVMDIDEEAFRENRLSARLYGYLRVPFQRQHLQSSKSGSSPGEEAALDEIAAELIRHMEPGVLYVIGSGTTTRAVMARLGLPNTLLGIDAVLDRRAAGTDLNEAQLLALVEKHPARIVLSVIGGQGFILGRGNQQISPRVIRAAGPGNLTVVASAAKLASLQGRPLLVDSGDPELDRELSGYTQVITGLDRRQVYPVEA
jgi:predicted polyphosphate/ATP-dependent NAD kinase